MIESGNIGSGTGEVEKSRELVLRTAEAKQARADLLALKHLGPENAEVIDAQTRFAKALQQEERLMTTLPAGVWISYHTAITFKEAGFIEYAREAAYDGIRCIDTREYDTWDERDAWLERFDEIIRSQT